MQRIAIAVTVINLVLMVMLLTKSIRQKHKKHSFITLLQITSLYHAQRASAQINLKYFKKSKSQDIMTKCIAECPDIGYELFLFK